jgi:hypothetical protein
MSAFKTLCQMYRNSLYVVLPFTTSVGFSTGLVEVFSNKPTAFDVFTDVIGYTTLGAATGLVYPITFPAMLQKVIMT